MNEKTPMSQSKGLLSHAEELNDDVRTIAGLVEDVRQALFFDRPTEGCTGDGLLASINMEHYTKDSLRMTKEIQEVLVEILKNLRG